MKLVRMVGRHPWIVTVAVLLFAWWWAADRDLVGATLLATPGEVFERFMRVGTMESNYEAIFVHAYETAVRAFEGWLIALFLGIALGVVLGTRKTSYSASEPVFEFARAIPPILAFPLLLVAFDYGEPAYVWTIVFGGLPIMVLAVARGSQAVDVERLEFLRLHQPSRLVRTVARAMEIVPAAFLGARLTFSISLVVAVVAEMVFTPRSGFGIGALARDAEISFDTPTFYACVLLVGAYGFACNLLLKAAERRFSGAKLAPSRTRGDT
jgi:ABC-type nitrate/sulfonate/bicarbonate transport system permease component